jgi:hypothetical protein
MSASRNKIRKWKNGVRGKNRTYVFFNGNLPCSQTSLDRQTNILLHQNEAQ